MIIFYQFGLYNGSFFGKRYLFRIVEREFRFFFVS